MWGSKKSGLNKKRSYTPPSKIIIKKEAHKKMNSKAIINIIQSSKNFKEIEEKIFVYAMKKAREICKKVLELMDDRLMEERDKEELEVHEKRSRCLDTLIGPIEFERRYYKKAEGGYTHLLDDFLGIPTNARVSPAIKAKALKGVKDLTYRKTADMIEQMLDIPISHNAIHDWVQEIGKKIRQEKEQETEHFYATGEIPEKKQQAIKAEHLFLEADGVFINIQGEEEKSSTELKIALSYLGWEERRKFSGEYEVKSKKVFGGVVDSDELWRQSSVGLLKNYELEENEVTILSGDAASWIDKAHYYLPYLTCRVLDDYHLQLKITKCLGRSSFTPKLKKALIDHDKEKVIEILDKAESYRKKDKDKKKVDQLRKYILDNWEKIKDFRDRGYCLPDDTRGMGVVESNIDKILANRFKKLGISWSVAGAENLASIIIADRNGELDEMITKEVDWEINQEKLTAETEGYITVKETAAKKDNQYFYNTIMPVFEGPAAGKCWVKSLKSIASQAVGVL